jgi:hypothetical protein
MLLPDLSRLSCVGAPTGAPDDERERKRARTLVELSFP